MPICPDRLVNEKSDAIVRLALSAAAFCKPHSFFFEDISNVVPDVLPSQAILYFEYLLTLEAELETFWRRGVSLPKLGFFLNRYLAVLGHIPVLYEFFGPQIPSVRSLCKPRPI